jgi:glycosyltransferase involved in cell wall biosynthesis
MPEAPSIVAVDTRYLSQEITGVGRNVGNLVSELERLAPPDLAFRLVCFDGRLPSSRLQNHVLRGIWRWARPLSLAQQVLLPGVARATGCHLFHYGYFDVPRGFSMPVVATCYDIEPLRHPSLFPSRIVWYYRAMSGGLRGARRVIAISKATADDLVELLGVRRDRIRVVPLAPDARFAPASSIPRREEIRRKYGLPGRFVLYVGNTMPHKNLPRLVSAIRRARTVDPSVCLIIAGGRDRYRALTERAISASGLMNDAARFIGRIPDDDLPFVYQCATVFAFPSLHEGFGLPVIEAMACGTPVVTSNLSSLPEVAGDAAILVDPLKEDELASGILCLFRDAHAAHEHASRGLLQARRFSWQRCAEQHIEIYREVLAQ